MIKELIFEKKLLYSDHRPLKVTVTGSPVTSLELVNECAESCFNDEHYDVSRKLNNPVKLHNLDLHQLVLALDDPLAFTISSGISFEELSVDEQCNVLTGGIYNAAKRCKINRRNKSYFRHNEKINISENCALTNYKAIADANFKRYQDLVNAGKPVNDYISYLETWKYARELACSALKQDSNKYIHKSWTDIRFDPKKLWEKIDWKGKKIEQKSPDVTSATVNKYFTNIFNSNKIKPLPASEAAHAILNSNNNISYMRDEISPEELNNAITKIGTGTGGDGIEPSITKILPVSVRKKIITFLNNVFSSKYPTSWQFQVLLALTKKGHTITDPKLRGIGIGHCLSRVYDIIIDNRFMKWYKPNKEQAGFREEQGCPLQLFLLYLMIDTACVTKQDLFICFLDYEKAFDFVDRCQLLKCMLENGVDSKFTMAIMNMYGDTYYLPKLSNNKIGKEIKTIHGMTQGKSSSAHFFSLYVSDMPEKTSTGPNDPSLIAQLADDTSAMAFIKNQLGRRIGRIFYYSGKKAQVINIGKTKYMEFSDNPSNEPLLIEDNLKVDLAENGEYIYLGLIVINSKFQRDHISKNISKKKVCISKYRAWLQNNKLAPVKLKLKLLYTCVFASILHASETWWDFDDKLRDELLFLERSVLKTILGVQQKGIPNDIVYLEIGRPDIFSSIQERQYKFITKLEKMSMDEALVKEVMESYRNTNMMLYFTSLRPGAEDNNKQQRRTRLESSDKTKTKRYFTITGGITNQILYDWGIQEEYRIPLTRWRFGCFNLAVVKSRYSEGRVSDKCATCNQREDESHVLYSCRLYHHLRNNFLQLLLKYPTVNEFLNPNTKEDANNAGRYIKMIEDQRKNT